jgi:hypothetical protein
VLIDGKPAPVADLDTYSPMVTWNHRTVLGLDLPNQRHTVTIEALGRKNEKSSNTYIQIVSFE